MDVAVETTYINLRQNLASVLALIPADELAGILETAHLLSSLVNARRLQNALSRADARGTAVSTINDLRQDVGLEAD